MCMISIVKVIISVAYTITACPQYGKTLRRYPFPYEVFGVHGVRNKRKIMELKTNKNSSGDEIANVNFCAVRPEAAKGTRIR